MWSITKPLILKQLTVQVTQRFSISVLEIFGPRLKLLKFGENFAKNYF